MFSKWIVAVALKVISCLMNTWECGVLVVSSNVVILKNYFPDYLLPDFGNIDFIFFTLFFLFLFSCGLESTCHV